MSVLNHVADYWPYIVRMCESEAKKVPYYVDDLIGECVDRLPGIVERWDSWDNTTLRRWVFLSLRRFIRKAVSREVVRLAGARSPENQPQRRDPEAHTFTDAVERKELAGLVLDGLTRAQVLLLKARHCRGLSIRKIAEAAGIDFEVVRNRLQIAESLARVNACKVCASGRLREREDCGACPLLGIKLSGFQRVHTIPEGGATNEGKGRGKRTSDDPGPRAGASPRPGRGHRGER